MNLLADAPAEILWLLALLMLAAGIEDAVRMRISNLLSAAVLLLAVAAAAIVGIEAGVWQNLLVFTLLLALGTWLFSTGKFGGGDVKMLAATGLWVDFLGAVGLLAAVFIAGGVLAFLVIGSRLIAPAALKSRVIVLRPGSGIPYGIAIAVGTLITIAAERLR